MKIIGFLSGKGGCGKTTLAINVACSLADSGRRVVLVDTDPQASATNWRAARENGPVPVIPMPRAPQLNDLPKLAAQFDFVLIDGAPREDELLRRCIHICDLVLVPATPSPYDIWALDGTVNSIKWYQAQHPEGRPLAAFVLNRVIQRARLAKEAQEALATLNLPVLDARITQRQAYAATAADGYSVLDWHASRAGAEEIHHLAGCILEILQ